MFICFICRTVLLRKLKSSNDSGNQINFPDPEQLSSNNSNKEGNEMFAYCFDTDGRRAFIKEITGDPYENKRCYVPKRQNNAIVAVDGKVTVKSFAFLF